MKKHNKIIAIQGDPIQSINRKTDTTLLLALEAQRRNYKIYYYETKNLTFSGNKIYALSKEVEFNENKKKFYFIKNSKKLDLSKVSFILIGIAAVTTIYWASVFKKMLKNVKPKYTAREAEAKNWVYDLIKGENQFVFVAEVPGPDDKIMVRLIDGMLYIRGYRRLFQRNSN